MYHNQKKTATRKAGALVSIVMSLILAFGAVSNAYGSVSFAWLNPAVGTQFTNIVTAPAFNFPLYAGIDINGDGTTSPFPTKGDATSVDWSVDYDPYGIVNGLKSSNGFYNPSGSDYYAYAIVNSVYSTLGAASILATYTPTGQYLNITIAIDAAKATTAENVDVYLVNTTAEAGDVLLAADSNGAYVASESGLTVLSPAGNTTSPLYNENQAFQYLPTATSALDAFEISYSLSPYSEGSYVEEIDGLGPGAYYEFGWTYAVYDASGNLLDIGNPAVISASVMMLDDGYTVVWKYIDYTDTVPPFGSTFAAEEASWSN